MKKLLFHSTVLCALLASAAGDADETRKVTKRIGDSTITIVGIEQQTTEATGPDHYQVAVHLRGENVGKQALCITFKATMKTTFGLEYEGSNYTPKPFRISELLPAEKTEGEYVFLLKSGVQPLQLTLTPYTASQTCARGKDSLSAVWHSAPQLTFDLSSPVIAPQREVPSSDGQSPDSSKVRVFVSDRNGRQAKQSALKVFFNRCPQALITDDKEKARYIVELVPASLTQSKNVVTVTNKSGDVIHTGATISLGNAAKDACSAVVKDFSADSGQSLSH